MQDVPTISKMSSLYIVRHDLSFKCPEGAHIVSLYDKVKDEIATMYTLNRKWCDTIVGSKAIIHTPASEKPLFQLLQEHRQLSETIRNDPVYWAKLMTESMKAHSDVDTWVIYDCLNAFEYAQICEAFPDSRILLV